MELCEQVYAEICRISSIVNRFDQNSELYKLNNNTSKDFVKISDDLFSMIKYSLESYSKTGGYFDITIQSFNNYSGGIDGIKLIEKDKLIQFSNPEIQIDLGGIAKGYVLDKIVEFLLFSEVDNFLINFGNSSIAAFGNHPNGVGWKLSLNDSAISYLLHNEFLTVSGNNSKERKHIINPYTHQFIEGKMEYSIVTSSGIEGEILATTEFINKMINL